MTLPFTIVAPSRGLFAREVLIGLGFTPTPKSELALIAQMEAEGTSARYNPMATTRVWPNSTTLSGNPAGVRHYACFVDGVRATVATLNLSAYHDVRVALRAGNSVQGIVSALRASDWDAGHYASGIPWERVAAAPDKYAAIKVAT